MAALPVPVTQRYLIIFPGLVKIGQVYTPSSPACDSLYCRNQDMTTKY